MAWRCVDVCGVFETPRCFTKRDDVPGSKHRTPRWMRISARIFWRARSFSSVDLATTLAAKDSPVEGSCIEYTTAKPPLPRGRPRTYVRVLVSPASSR